MAGDGKSFLALVNGLARHDYYNDTDITDELLHQELYPDLPDADFLRLVQKARGITNSLAMTAMDLDQSETFLETQMKKKDGGISQDQAKAFTKFWKNNWKKIHDSLVERSSWNNKLQTMSWRIDVETRARHADQVNTPTAIVELQIASSELPQKGAEVVRFEMDENTLAKTLDSLKDIDSVIAKYCDQ